MTSVPKKSGQAISIEPPILTIRTRDLRECLARTRHAEVFALDESWVVKLYRHHIAFSEVCHQHRIDVLIAGISLVVPKVSAHIVEDIDSGRYGIVYQRIDGVPMTELLRRAPGQLLRQADVLAGQHVLIQSIDTSMNLPSSKERLAKRILMARQLQPQQAGQLLHLLDRLPDGNALCHGDLHSDNILLTALGPVVIDWSDATIGDGLCDVARTWVIFRFALPRLAWATRVYALAFAGAYLRAYRRRTRCAIQDLAAWKVVNAAARLLETSTAQEERVLLGFLCRALPALKRGVVGV